MKRMNSRLNLPSLQKIMMDFERESEIMDLKEEAISDTIDDVIGEEDDEEVYHSTPTPLSLCGSLYFILFEVL